MFTRVFRKLRNGSFGMRHGSIFLSPLCWPATLLFSTWKTTLLLALTVLNHVLGQPLSPLGSSEAAADARLFHSLDSRVSTLNLHPTGGPFLR